MTVKHKYPVQEKKYIFSTTKERNNGLVFFNYNNFFNIKEKDVYLQIGLSW